MDVKGFLLLLLLSAACVRVDVKYKLKNSAILISSSSLSYLYPTTNSGTIALPRVSLTAGGPNELVKIFKSSNCTSSDIVGGGISDSNGNPSEVEMQNLDVGVNTLYALRVESNGTVGPCEPVGTYTLSTPHYGMTSVVGTDSGYAAIRADGSIITWGNISYGSDSSSIASEINGTIPVTDISSTNGAFAAQRNDGSVISWGSPLIGGEIGPVNQAFLLNSRSIVSSLTSFFAVTFWKGNTCWGSTNVLKSVDQ